MNRPILINLAGPDGAGKSAISAAVSDRLGDIRVRVYHVKPRIRGSADTAAVVANPHSAPARGLASAGAKTLWWYLRYQLVYRVVVRVADLGLVIVERGWHDQIVDPARYRHPYGMTPALRVLGRTLPKYDLHYLLAGAPAIMSGRKSEVGVAETARQVDAWRRLLAKEGRPVVELDTVVDDLNTSVDRIVGDIRDLRASVGRWRGPVVAPARLGLAYRGPSGKRLSALVYHPQRRSARIAASLPFSRRRPECSGWRTVTELLRRHGIDQGSVATMRSGTRDRIIVVAGGSRSAYFLKLGGRDDTRIDNEAGILDSFAGMDLGFHVARLVDHGMHDQRRFLLTRGLELRRRSAPDAAMVADLAADVWERTGLTHGDFAPWNMGIEIDGGPALWDWESARAGDNPLADLIHFVIQQEWLLGNRDPRSAVDLLVRMVVPRFADRVGLAKSAILELASEYLSDKTGSQDESPRMRQGMLAVMRTRDWRAR